MSDNTPKRPTRLDIVDMPRDKARVLGGLRQAICASFNYCRKYPAKLEVLRETLEYVLGRIDTYQEDAAKFADKQAKAKLEAEAKELGIELDSRKTVENMTQDLEDAKVELEAKEYKEGLLAKAKELNADLTNIKTLEDLENAVKLAEDALNSDPEPSPNPNENPSEDGSGGSQSTPNE